MKTKPTKRQKKPTAVASNIPPPPQPQHRPLDLDCHLGEAEEHHHGALISIRAAFNPISGQVEILATAEDYRFAKLSLDYAQTRAVLHRFQSGLSDLARLRGSQPRIADFEKLRQFNASQYKSPNQIAADIQLKPFPWREMVLLCAHSSASGFYFSTRLYLTTLEAEAITFDLERALRDMERFTDIGL
jgi:hypothetical protein